jgi:hypothetical protein
MTAPTYAQMRERWKNSQKAQHAIYAKVAPTKRPSGPEIVAALKDIYAASGDRRVAEAIDAIQELGFDRANAGTWKRAHAKIFGPTNETVVERMRRLVKHGASVRHAAARIAVEFLVPGKHFDAVVQRLTGIYRQARVEGDAGDHAGDHADDHAGDPGHAGDSDGGRRHPQQECPASLLR